MTVNEPRAGSRASRGPARARRWPGWLMIVGGFVGLVIATTVIEPGLRAQQTKLAVILGAIIVLIFLFVIIAGVITLIRGAISRARARSSSTEGS